MDGIGALARAREAAGIWRKEAYRQFRRSFSKGPLLAQCRTCPKLHGN